MINAATVAFSNAGSVSLNGITCAVAVVRRMSGELVVDPSEEEEEVDPQGVSRSFLPGTWATRGRPRHVCTHLGRKSE